MSLNDLLPKLLKLTHEEKLEAIRILQEDLDHRHVDELVYEVWSPQITLECSRLLIDMLREDKANHS